MKASLIAGLIAISIVASAPVNAQIKIIHEDGRETVFEPYKNESQRQPPQAPDPQTDTVPKPPEVRAPVPETAKKPVMPDAQALEVNGVDEKDPEEAVPSKKTKSPPADERKPASVSKDAKEDEPQAAETKSTAARATMTADDAAASKPQRLSMPRAPLPLRKPSQPGVSAEPVSTNTKPARAFISRNEALAIAIENAPPARNYVLQRTMIDGKPAYAVDFKTDEGAYTVNIDAESGAILN
jgi:uncharacterized membrane protein YkoI